MPSRSFPDGFGAQITAAPDLDANDGALWAIDGLVRNVAPSAGRGCVYTAANTGAAYTATRTILNEDFLLTVTANTTITLAGGGITGEMSVWNIVFVEDSTGGRTITVSDVEWFGGLPTFTTTAQTANACLFVQYGTGQIYGYFGGAASAVTTYGADTFTRADSSTALGTAETGGAWTAVVGTWGITNNHAYLPTGTNDAHNTATLAVAQANVTVSADVTLSATLNRAAAGLVLRYADANNWLRVYLMKNAATPNSIVIHQFVAGALTVLGEVTSAGLANGTVYNLKVVLAGFTCAVTVDGVEKISATAFNVGLTTQTYGINIYKAAAGYDDAGSSFDNFLVTS